MWAICGFCGFFAPLGSVAEAAQPKNNILVIHSYNAELPWTASLEEGLNDYFSSSEHDVQLFHEFLDAKRFPNLGHQSSFLENIKDKYGETPIDLVVVSDDPGLAMVLKQREQYFPEQPLVFLGINKVQPELLNMPGVTGVFETHDQLHTATEGLRQTTYEGMIVLSDSSETGQAESEQASQILQLPNPPKQLVLLQDLTADTLTTELEAYPAHWPVLLVGQLRDGSPNGPLITVGDTTDLVRSLISNPLYGASKAHIENGVVGGKILDGEHHAMQTAGLVEQILNGISVDDIAPITQSENVWFFDAQELQRFGIDESVLPAESRLLNIQTSFYEQHWRLVWLTGAGFAVTLLVIALLMEVIRRGAISKHILEENQIRYRDLAEAGANVFWELDREMRFSYISGNMADLHGIQAQDFFWKTPEQLLSQYSGVEFDWQNFSEKFHSHLPIEDFQFCSKEHGQTLRIFKINGKPIFEGDAFLGYRGIKREITKEYQLAEDLAYQATYDVLTGLVNRQTFDHTLQQTVRRVQEVGLQAVLCYLDLDQFKIVNDTAGHLVGDRLLTEIAQVLQETVKDGDVLGRLGGDEFGLLLINCSLDQAQAFCEALIQKVREYRFRWAERQFQVGVSIGLVPIEAERANAVELLSFADFACYRAKELGRNQAYVTKPGDTTLAMQLQQMGHLATLTQALEEDRFFLVQQPIVALSKDSDAPHFEVLLRLRDEKGMVVSPGFFIPEAERYGLIPQIDRWVLKKTLQTLPKLNLPGDSVVSINLSGASLSNESFLQEVIALIQEAAQSSDLESRVSPHCICFEITETAAISHLESVKCFMHHLKSLGVQFALDDFGSGVSSFGYLRELPVEFLKIDGSLVHNIHQDSTNREIVAMITKLANVMSIQTIAEFVENDAIREELMAIGVDYGQGYGIAKPQPLDNLKSLSVSDKSRALSHV